MNGFEKYNLKHTSASQINMFASAPDAWAAKYIYGAKFKFGVAPLIGTLVEQVVQDVLLGGALEDSLEQAHKTFHKETALNSNEKDLARISNIKDMAEIALGELAPYGTPEFIHDIDGVKQQRIELVCNGDGWKLPIIGFLDFVYPKHNLIIDLKTTMRCPTFMSPMHQRQGSIYAGAREGFDVKFLYVTPKKSNLIDVDNVKETLQDIKNTLNRQEKLLRALDAETLKQCIPANFDSFYWKDSESIFKELFG